MRLNTIYSVNRWLKESLEGEAPVAFHPDESLVLPSYRVKWGRSRAMKLKPAGKVIGTDFVIYCVARRGEYNVSRRLASVALRMLKRWNEGAFFVPRYILGSENEGPVDYVAFKNIEVSEDQIPEHPELAIEKIRAIVISISSPTNDL